MGFSPGQPLLEGETPERDVWWGTVWPLSPLPLGVSPRLPSPQRGMALSSEPSPRPGWAGGAGVPHFPWLWEQISSAPALGTQR